MTQPSDTEKATTLVERLISLAKAVTLMCAAIGGVISSITGCLNHQQLKVNEAVGRDVVVDTKRLVEDRTGKPEDKQAVQQAEQAANKANEAANEPVLPVPLLTK